MEKKEIKKKIILNDRVDDSFNEDYGIDNTNDKNLTRYRELKEDLKLNLKDDIDNKIQRMKILYEIKQKELYKYDDFKSFEQFIKSYVIAKSQAYVYLKIYEKVLEGAISIEKIKEIGFTGVYQHIQKGTLEVIQKEKNNKNIPIRILVKDEEVYDFCKEDTKRLYFIIEELVKNNKDILYDFVSKYRKWKREKNRK